MSRREVGRPTVLDPVFPYVSFHNHECHVDKIKLINRKWHGMNGIGVFGLEEVDRMKFGMWKIPRLKQKAPQIFYRH